MASEFLFSDRTDMTESDLRPVPFERYQGMMLPEDEPHITGMIVSQEERDLCVAQLASWISDDYKRIMSPGETVVVTPLLNGALPFSKDLGELLRVPMETETMKVETYGGGTSSSGEVKIHKDFSRSVKGKHVLLVEDIVETGNTIDFMINGLLKHKGPKSVKLVTFLDKPSEHNLYVPIDYIGFSIPNMFVIGYGLDYDNRLRNLPFVGVYKE